MFKHLEEHHGYLSDEVRMEKFRQAIPRAVKPGDTVLDLACGTGIMGWLSLQAGAGHVTFVDETDILEVARRSLMNTEFADRCTFIKGHSSEVELEDRVDVIVSDNIGYVGIDYGAMAMLHDASQRFLRPGGRIVPNRLRLYAALVDLDGPATQISRWRDDTMPEIYHWLGSVSADVKIGTNLSDDDLLGPPAQLIEIELGTDRFESDTWKAKLSASKAGAASGIVCWFESDLADGVTMTNGLGVPESITRPQALLPIDLPIEMSAGEVMDVTIQPRPDDDIWTWRARTQDGTQQRAHTTWRTLSMTSVFKQRTAKSAPAHLSRAGRIYQAVFSYCDGTRTADEIVQAVLTNHADLYPTEAALRAAVAQVLGTFTTSKP